MATMTDTMRITYDMTHVWSGLCHSSLHPLLFRTFFFFSSFCLCDSSLC